MVETTEVSTAPRDILICGIDEVGRGSLAGPIVAVAALFKGFENFALQESPILGLKDSKKFSSAASRKKIFEELVWSKHLLDFGIGCIWPSEINKIGIEAANSSVFYLALDDLKKEPDYLYVDGVNPVRNFQLRFQKVEPKADLNYWPVSAASILAKVIRDDLMGEFHLDYPQYG